MALTKDDIEAAIAQTENQDAIRHSLSNYFEDLNEPVAVAIGIGDNRWDRDLNPQYVDKIVNLLRDHGIDAVSFLDPQAAQADKFVVNESGVLCPFMSPQDSLKAATLIADTAIKDGYQIVGHINPQTTDNILYTANSSIKIKNDGARLDQGINLEESHPDHAQFKEIEQRNGGDYKSFIDKKINEAYAGSKVVDFDAIDKKNVYENGMADLYRGGTLGANPYATVSQWNSRKVAHSSPAISVCVGFSGKGKTMSSRGGAVYEKTQSGVEYGFVYKLESMGDKQQYYHNVGLETGDNPRIKDEVNLADSTPWNDHNGEIYESPILPHHNKLKEIYIFVGKPGEKDAKLYPIPLDENGKIANQEWRDFMALHEPTDDKVLGYLKDRQDTQKREQTADPGHVYGFELKQGLEPDRQEYLNNMTARDFLRNFIHDSEIKETESGLHVDTVSDGTALNMEGLKLEQIPDLSNVKITGHWGLNSNTISKVDATKLPECTNGLSLLGVDVENVYALSADKFINIIGAKKTKEGFLDCEMSSHNTLSCDGMPEGFDKLKFMRLPSGVNLVYDSIEKVPETLTGIGMSGITIKDQSSIETMPAMDFIYKMKGNLGTHPLGFDVSVMYSEGVRHTEIHDDIQLHLESTNISTMPADMKHMTLRQIVLNHEAVVTSLDNFPITKEGILDLNFKGDLKNETMESFLLKTKGKEWVANNTSKAEDGHLIIEGNLDFRTGAWGPRDRPKMDITSFPKDIDKVEIKGSVEPYDLHLRLDHYLKTMKDKDADSLSISYDTNLKMDLSNHKATNICISGKSQEIILPPTIKSVHIADSKDFQPSVLKNAPQNLDLSFSNVNNEMPLDMAKLTVGRLSFYKSSVAEITFPAKTETLYLSETKLSKPVILPEGIKSLSAQATNFPDGSVLNLSECKEVSLINCTLPKDAVLDLSKCGQVELRDVDLSHVNVIMPERGRVIIGENVKFSPDYKLDLSNCERGYIDPSVQCGEIKLPQSLIIDDPVHAMEIPSKAKEITTSCIAHSFGKVNIPPHVTIVDTPDKNGKSISLKILKACGLSKEQISTLRKERIKNKLKGIFKKILPQKTETKSKVITAATSHRVTKKRQPEIEIDEAQKARLVALSGRTQTATVNTVPAEVSAKTLEQPTSVPQTPEQTVQPTTPSVSPGIQPAASQVTAQAPEDKKSLPKKIAEMGKKGFREFVSNLRKGYNMITGEGTSPSRIAAKEPQQQSNNAQNQVIDAAMKAKSSDYTR